jgi:drug/metabolite transporter (DMT)-like permease
MINLLLTVLFSSLLYIVFKFFSKYNINTFQAIVFNYIIAFLVGLLISEETIDFYLIQKKSWLLGSFVLGGLFLLVFNILGKTSQENGVSVASVSSKMSMIIPILFGIFFFKETITFQKIIGIGIALIAVYFTSKKESGKIEIKNFIFPILLFFGAGIVDTSINYLQYTHLKVHEIAFFSATTFLAAFFFGILVSIIKIIKGTFKFEGKNIIGGLFLGIPNYFSMYFLIKALHNKNIESATVFTLINIGVILLSTFFGIILFKEKLLKQNYLGIALAILAVILVTQ